MEIKIWVSLLTIVALSFLAVPNSSDGQALYKEWKNKLGASFSAAEDLYQYKIFEENLLRINKHNTQPNITHTEGLNRFAFLTAQEFRFQHLQSFEIPQGFKEVREGKNGPIVDWVKYGAVSPVKDQGSCTASYAFSAVAAL